MPGIIYADGVEIKATTDHMRIAFKSGGETFRFHLPHAIAVEFWQRSSREGWPILCAPQAEVVPFIHKAARKRREKADRGSGSAP